MLKQLMYKWFGLSDPPCATCEILRDQLEESNRERRELLTRLLEPKTAEPPPSTEEKHVPITPNFVPWRVKQQMLEAEDKKRAQLMRDRTKEIDQLEKELGVDNAGAIS